MKLTSVDLNLFVVFEAIYTERNLTRASEVLNVTQPAVSNALARLRAVFADPLFERRSGAMIPTAVSQSLIEPVRQALARLRSGLDQRTAFDPATSERVFHIAVREAVAGVLLPTLAGRLQRAAPHIQIQSHLVERPQIAVELASGTLDFALDIPQLARSDLAGAPLMNDRYVCVLRRGHPLAGQPMAMNVFLELRQIAISSRRRGKTLIEAALGRLGHSANMVMRLPNYHAAFDVLRASDLIAAAPYQVVRRYGDLVHVELPFPPPPLETMLFWHRSAESDPANQWLRTMLIEAAAAAAPPSAARGKNAFSSSADWWARWP